MRFFLPEILLYSLVHFSIIFNLVKALDDSPVFESSDGDPGASIPEHSVFVREEDTEWDYEPRVWSMDAVANEGDHDDDDETVEELTTGDFDLQDDRDAEASNFATSHTVIRENNLRNLQHYLTSEIQPNNRQNKDECTQFRVDTRDAIICERKRCDKLAFEWPKFDNQIALIETTKHGMRFHRTDLAFARPSKRSAQMSGVDHGPTKGKFDLFELIKPSNTTTPPGKFDIFDLIKPSNATTSPGKFDLFELFKPSTTTTTTTSPTSATTEAATTSATTLAPNSNGTASENVTSTNGAQGERNGHLNSQDANTTQLITTLRLDSQRRRQTMIGFGGALSDSTCRNMRSLSSEMSKSLMEDYFGDQGLRYNIARMTIGSSDFSTTPYTNNDRTKLRQQEAEMDDVEMNNFHLTEEDYQFKLPIARQAIATSRHELKLFASLWSPPIWMKNNSNIVHGYLKGDIYGPYYRALAELMIKWLEAYRKNGVDFWALSGLNEPVTGVKPFIFHNSLGITRDDYVTFYKIYLGPMIRQRGFGNLSLIILDDNKGYAPNWVKAMLEDEAAAKYISGVGYHWYMNDEYENLNFISKKYPDKFILSTEACNGYLPFQVHALPGNWDRGVAYLFDIIKGIQKNSAGWVDWNMALDLMGGPTWAKNYLDAAVIVNAKRDEYYKSPMYYAIGHLSRFVERGSIRLDYRIANARYDYPLEAVGFLTPKNYIVIVTLNANHHSVPFKIIVDRKLVRIVNLRPDSFNTIIFKWKNKSNK